MPGLARLILEIQSNPKILLPGSCSKLKHIPCESIRIAPIEWRKRILFNSIRFTCRWRIEYRVMPNESRFLLNRVSCIDIYIYVYIHISDYEYLLLSQNRCTTTRLASACPVGVCPSSYASIRLAIYLSIYIFIHPCICLLGLPTSMSIYLYTYL